MPAGQPFDLADLSGGLNLLDSPVDLALNQSPDLLNYTAVGEGGAITQRDGDVAYSAALPNPAQYLFFSFALQWIIAVSVDGHVYSIDTSTGTITSRRAGGLSLLGASFIDAPSSGGQGPIYGLVPDAVGQRAAIQWNGVAASTSAWTASAGILPYAARQILWLGNRVWALGSNGTFGDLHGLLWSELGDPRNWPAANINRFDPNDGDELTVAAPWGSTLIVFKRRKAWLVYDLDTGANRPLTYGAGANTFAITTPSGVIFDDPDQGMMITDGSSVKPLPNGNLAMLGTTTSPWIIQSSMYLGNSIYIGVVNGAGTQDRVFEYDLRLKAWFFHDGASVLTPGLKANGPNIIGAKATGGGALDWKSAAVRPLTGEGGGAIATRYTTPWLARGNPMLKKRVQTAFIDGQGVLTATVRRDFKSAAAMVRGPFTLDPVTSPTEQARLNGLGVARAFQVQLDGSSTTKRARLEAIRFYMAERGR